MIYCQKKENISSLYALAEVSYKMIVGKLVDNSKLFPDGWYSINDISFRTNILAEAIEKKCIVENTCLYIDYIKNNDKVYVRKQP